VLKPYPDTVSALQAKAGEIAELGDITLDQEGLNVGWVAKRVGDLIETLNIVDNETKIVERSKALHHLLPDLVPPMIGSTRRNSSAGLTADSNTVPTSAPRTPFAVSFGLRLPTPSTM
jgi:hypothetical protein